MGSYQPMSEMNHTPSDSLMINHEEYDTSSPRASHYSNSDMVEILSTVSLTLTLWTFITFYLVLFLIHYIRRVQYFSLYDKCTSKNAYFQYDFHIVFGRHSITYNRNESIIIDSLDNHGISVMSIQIPGSTIFNNSQMFMYRHSRSQLRCVQFSIYRRYPIKEIKGIRVAHSCSNPDSRLYIYGLDLYDCTNNETKFFPISSVVKYRGTQWALSTSFEPKPDASFKRLGVECYDPFGLSNWPNYLELLTILLLVWCLSYYIGYLFSDYNQILVYISVNTSIVAALTAAVAIIYLRLVKTHIVSGHYESDMWRMISFSFLLAIIIISIISIALANVNRPSDCTRWLIGSVTSATLLTVLILFVWLVAMCRRSHKDSALVLWTDTNLAKTNSKEGIQFVNDPTQNVCASFLTQQEASNSRRPTEQAKNTSVTSAKVPNSKNVSKSLDRKLKNTNTSQGALVKKLADARKTEDYETLDTAFNQDSIMPVKNRNSISQYV